MLRPPAPPRSRASTTRADRFSPSRCAILPSLRSLTVAGVNSVAGCRAAASRQETRRTSRRSPRPAHRASAAPRPASATGTRRASGSHACAPRSPPNHARARSSMSGDQRRIVHRRPAAASAPAQTRCSGACRCGSDRSALGRYAAPAPRQHRRHRRRPAAPPAPDRTARPSHTAARTPPNYGSSRYAVSTATLLGREQRLRQRRDLGRLGHVGKQPPQPVELPPAMAATVPVEAAVKDRVQRPRRLHVVRPGHHMVELVRPFARDVPQRQPRKRRAPAPRSAACIKTPATRSARC